MAPSIRFRFEDFVLSPRQRLLLRAGTPVPLIPKYFDLLVLLIDRRQDAVSKQAIFNTVWSDVVVTDGALSQAIRTLRRTLGDNSREPRFIRTVSRHGYQFVYADVQEEPDDGSLATSARLPAPPAQDSIEQLVDRLFATASADTNGSDEILEIAERLHALNTAEAIALITRRSDHAAALAVMRDARWNVPGAGRVPLDTGSSLELARRRMADARRTMARRWAGAATSGALGGIAAGLAGGIALSLSPGSQASLQSLVALAALGAVAGGVGASAIGAGLAAAEVLARSRRGPALAVCGAVAGALVGGLAHLISRALLDGLLGTGGIAVPGALEGLVVGGAIGTGYALATRQPPGGGIAAPVGSRRIAAAAVVALTAAASGAALALGDRMLVGGLVNGIAQASPNAQLVLAPLGQLIGEPDFGRFTRILLSAFEAGALGGAVAWGLTIRPKSATSH